MEIDDLNQNIIYNLCMPIQHHKDTLRTVACNNNGLVVTGSFDRTCAFYQCDSKGNYNFLKDTHYHDDFIYIVRPDVLNHGFFSGGKDKRIIYMDNEGNPLGEYYGENNGHTGTVCSISQSKCNPNIFISGSWDTTAIIWDINQQVSLNVLQGHAYAVTVLALPNSNYVTGSQDKALNFWDKNGNKITSIPNAHGDIIRAIIVSPSGETIFTTSNDETVKEWSFNGQLLNTFVAHESFIFSMCANSLTKQIFTCGDDRCVKVWSETGNLQQNLPHPNTVWDGCINYLNGDLLTACSDGFLRVFSSQKERWMSQEALEQYNNLCEMANAQDEGNGDKQQVDINTLPSITEMASLKNIKDGEIRLFNNFGKAEAYCYKASENQWQLLGEVTGQNNAPQKKYYPGDGVFKAGEYDYIFDVELEGGMTKLPFNEGDNILMAAEKFIGRERLHKAYTDDIMKFLRSNTGKNKKRKKTTITQEKDYSKPKNVQKKPNPRDSKPQATQHYSFPNLSYILYDSVNSEGPIKKITELNSKIEENDPLNKKLQDYQLKLINKVITTIGNKNFYHNSKFGDMELKEYLNLFTAWHGDLLIPVFDVFRMYLMHPESGLLFKQVGGGIEQLTILLQSIKNSNNITIKILILRCLCNLFNNEYSKSLLTVTKKDDILNIISGLQDINNKNIRNGIVSLIFNYSCNFSTNDDSEGAIQLCAIINELLGKEENEDNIVILLQALANLFVVSINNRNMGNEMDEKSVINDINDNGNSRIKELKDYLLILLD
jgi:phospholipase A-2-activating protein